MDWISGMQKSIDYMEEHILEDMDYEVIAAQSFSSSYHFQRVFSIVFGMSIGEYLRRRRLSLAGAELSSGNIKVIDAALKYGYELDKWERENLYNRDVTGVDFVDGLGFEEIVIPKATYVVFETKDIDKPIDDYEKLLRQRIDIVTEWMPSLGFELADAQELIAYHWNPKAERCVQIWLPIKKK